MPSLTPVLVAADELVGFCRINQWACCLIGGLAVQRWGEPALNLSLVRSELEPLLAAKDDLDSMIKLESMFAG